jgi:hypothetical protein
MRVQAGAAEGERNDDEHEFSDNLEDHGGLGNASSIPGHFLK